MAGGAGGTGSQELANWFIQLKVEGGQAVDKALDQVHAKLKAVNALSSDPKLTQLLQGQVQYAKALAEAQKALRWDVLVAEQGKFQAALTVTREKLEGLARIGKIGFATGLGAILGTGALGSPDAIATLTGSFQLLGAAIGQSFIPYIVKASWYVQDLFWKYQSLSQAQKDSIAKWVVFGTAASGVLMILPKVIAGIQAVTKTLAALTLVRGGGFLGGLGALLGVGAIAIGASADLKSGEGKKLAEATTEFTRNALPALGAGFVELANTLGFHVIPALTGFLKFLNLGIEGWRKLLTGKTTEEKKSEDLRELVDKGMLEARQAKAMQEALEARAAGKTPKGFGLSKEQQKDLENDMERYDNTAKGRREARMGFARWLERESKDEEDPRKALRMVQQAQWLRLQARVSPQQAERALQLQDQAQGVRGRRALLLSRRFQGGVHQGTEAARGILQAAALQGGDLDQVRNQLIQQGNLQLVRIAEQMDRLVGKDLGPRLLDRGRQ